MPAQVATSLRTVAVGEVGFMGCSFVGSRHCGSPSCFACRAVSQKAEMTRSWSPSHLLVWANSRSKAFPVGGISYAVFCLKKKISRIEAHGIVLNTKSGISKVYFGPLPKEAANRV